MDDDTYRAMLMGVAGVDSASKLDYNGMTRVLKHLRSSGFTVNTVGKNEWAFVFGMPQGRQVYAKKIYRLAQKLGENGQPKSKAYIEGIASQMAGATKPLQFCDEDDLRKIVQALEVHIKRRGV